MKLVSVRVQNYKCIDDSEEFSVRDLTCLAGKNESGKTALLQALRRLNPVEDNEKQFNTLMEYPRRRVYEVEGQDSPAHPVLTTRWELSDEDIRTVAHLVGPNAIVDRAVTVKKGYDNGRTWGIQIDESEVVSFLLSQIVELTEPTKQRLSVYSSLMKLHSHLLSNQNRTKGETLLLEHIEREIPGGDCSEVVRSRLVNRLPSSCTFQHMELFLGKFMWKEFQTKPRMS